MQSPTGPGPVTSGTSDLAARLPDSEQRFRDLFERSLAGMYLTTAAGRILDCNPAFAEIFGYERAELLRIDARELYFEVAARHENLDHLRTRGQVVSGETRMRRRDGSAVWVLFSEQLRPQADGVEVIEGTLLDITARREAELALEEGQHRMSQALRAARAGAWEWNMASDRVVWSAENHEVLGYSPGAVEASYQAWRARVHPDDVVRAEREVAEAVASRGNLDVQFRIVRPDGAVRWIRDVGRLVLDPAGQPTGMYGIQIDVTERALAEESLRASEERLQSLVNEMPVVLFVLDREGTITLSEGRALALLGLRPGEAVGRSALDMYAAYPAVVSELRRALAGEVAHATLDIGPVTFDTTFTPMRDAGGSFSGVVGVAQDVTERRRAEEELRRNQKLESIGVLAGGLAHDFNNLLTSILANVSLAKDADSEDERREFLEDAVLASARARDLTRQLLTFSRGGAPVRKTLALPRVLRETLGFALAGTAVVGEAVIAPDLWALEADEGQLVQALNNLLLNAAQAMPRGGRVVLRASNLPARTAGDGPRVSISVEDQGTGIPPGDLPRIFDPYFTTKQKGNGLGLAVVHSIVRAHGGRVGVASEPGRGSIFTLELPASPGAAADGPRVRPEPARGRGRILLMDDEPLVRKSAERALTRLGYEVVTAGDGAEALRCYEAARAGGASFDAVILDLTVPGGMGGAETMARLLELDPAVKAIVSSGYTSGSAMADHRAHGFAGVLEKPWQLQDLGETLRRILGG